MPSSISIDDVRVTQFFEAFKGFQETGVKFPMKKAGNVIKYKLVDNIRKGQDIHGDTYPTIKAVTNDMQVARSGPYTDTRKRSDVSSSQTAMNVTGKTASSIQVGINGTGDLEVYYDEGRTDVVLKSNATNPGNTFKRKRDPVGLTERNPSDFEFGAVADAIEDAIDRLIDGF